MDNRSRESSVAQDEKCRVLGQSLAISEHGRRARALPRRASERRSAVAFSILLIYVAERNPFGAHPRPRSTGRSLPSRTFVGAKSATYRLARPLHDAWVDSVDVRDTFACEPSRVFPSFGQKIEFAGHVFPVFRRGSVIGVSVATQHARSGSSSHSAYIRMANWVIETREIGDGLVAAFHVRGSRVGWQQCTCSRSGTSRSAVGWPMGKRIILLSDGTGNSAAKVWRTNVWRLFQSLDLRPSDQVAMYDDGVGTSSFKPMALLGGAFGIGLKRNVLDLYKFLCRNYKSKEDYEALAKPAQDHSADGNTPLKELQDDDIFLFGFSRGAFTVRILTGLVLTQGLVRFNSEPELERNVRAAYRAYRTLRYPGWTLDRPFRYIRNLFATHTHNAEDRPVAHIRFIGVWDTVAAYGSPIDEVTRGFSQYIWPLELPSHTLSDRVIRACHALAIDEERTSFTPELWEEAATSLPRCTKDERVSQVWFAGVHANVGGGYPDDSLANVSLSWMMVEAADCGLRFKEAPEADPDAIKFVKAAQDKDGRLYDSRSGIGGYYRYGPRKISEMYEQLTADHMNIPVPKIHESVFARIQVGAHLYAPIGLPDRYAVVGASNRTIQPLGRDTLETCPSAAKRHAEQESVWNVVWRRRVIYFLTVFASLYLALYPLVRESYAYQEMATRLRIVADTIELVGAFLPSGAKRWLTGYAHDPGWFLLWAGVIAFLIWYGSTLKAEINTRMHRIWNMHLARTPGGDLQTGGGLGWTIAWAALVGLLAYVAIYPVFDHISILRFLKLRGAGNGLVATYSQQPVRFVVWVFLLAHFIPEPTVEWLRTRPLYKLTLRSLKYKIAPFVFAILILYGAFAVGNHVLFNVRDSFGSFCTHTRNERGPLSLTNAGLECQDGRCQAKTITFDSSVTGTDSLCLATGVFAERGKRYSIRIDRNPQKEKWTFWNVPSFMSGQPIAQVAWWKQPVLALAFPLRRTLDRPWNSLIVRYGTTGTEESFLDRTPPPLNDSFADKQDYTLENVPDEGESLEEGWTARRDGEIYLYLNKPILGVWGFETVISKFLVPSTGTARVTINSRGD